MIHILAGEKGEGKTKRLIDLANEAGKVSDGHVVFIDDDKRHMYDLHYNIRFVETTGFLIGDYKIFFGFICGILSQDGDIQKMYIDGLNKTIKDITNEDLVDFVNKLEEASKESNVDFTLVLSCKKDTLPQELKACLI